MGSHLIDVLEGIPRKSRDRFSQSTIRFWDQVEYEIFSLAVYMMLDQNSWNELNQSDSDSVEVTSTSTTYSSEDKQKPVQ